MNIVWILLKTILWYAGLMYASVNLIGIVIRSFINEQYAKEQNFRAVGHRNMGYLFSFITIAYLYFLWNRFHWGFSVSALVLILCRIPDVFWEYENGEAITSENLPKRTIDYITNILSWVVIFLVFYAVKNMH